MVDVNNFGNLTVDIKKPKIEKKVMSYSEAVTRGNICGVKKGGLETLTNLKKSKCWVLGKSYHEFEVEDSGVGSRRITSTGNSAA